MRRLQGLCWSVVFGMAGILLGFQVAQGPDKDLQPNGRGIGTLQHPPMPEQSAGNPQARPGGGPKSSGGSWRIASGTVSAIS